ncbi:MAG: D-TA family PLP-dependent enzyme [Mariniblastus sp.]|nr:D-TA family PLP-dependent enzyme [Mariniblastus sp.]
MNKNQAADHYTIHDADEIFSPGLLIFKELVEHNLKAMIQMAGGPHRLCPHCKTHKTREIIRIEKAMGIMSHKCATVAEAEMLATEGIPEILLAYQMVGPNLKRMVELVKTFPDTQFTTLIDHPTAAGQLGRLMKLADQEIAVLIDLNPGMDRTGIEPGPNAMELLEMVMGLEGLQLQGLHWYDGQNRHADLQQRRLAVDNGWNRFTLFRDQVLMNGIPIQRIVAAGSGSFPILAEKGEPQLQLSPGTTVLFDSELAEIFPEMPFIPAIGILTRVVSRNRWNEVTLDVGHKSCAADQPAGNRLRFPQFPNAKEINQTEEHLVISDPAVNELNLGDAIVALPRHACPTTAVHQFADVISNHERVAQWKIAARDRMLTI